MNILLLLLLYYIDIIKIISFKIYWFNRYKTQLKILLKKYRMKLTHFWLSESSDSEVELKLE